LILPILQLAAFRICGILVEMELRAQNRSLHTYAAGVYDVSLVVTSSEGCVSSLTIPGYIEVLPVPIADASVVEDITHPYDLSQAPLSTFRITHNMQQATTGILEMVLPALK
jgi:PKD repeat protein